MGELRLQDLLEDLSDDGVIDSTGGFTLDPAAAEEKLRDFALPAADDYLLKIIQFAVANGSPTIEILSQPRQFQVVFAGEPIQESDINGLMSHLLTNNPTPRSRRFRHLAAGMRGAVAVRPSAITLEFCQGRSRFQRVWDEKGWRLEKLDRENDSPHHRFVLTRSLSQVWSTAGEELKAKFKPPEMAFTPEESKIVAACGYCPSHLILENRPLPSLPFGTPRYPGYNISQDPNPGESRPPRYIDTTDLVDGTMDGEHHLIEACYPASESEPASLVVPLSEATLRLGAQPGSPQRCRAWLAIEANLKEPVLTFVEDGVVLCQLKPDLACPGFVGVISAELLSKDLTGFQLVKDERFRKFEAWIEAEAKALRDQVTESLALYPNRESLKKALAQGSLSAPKP